MPPQKESTKHFFSRNWLIRVLIILAVVAIISSCTKGQKGGTDQSIVPTGTVDSSHESLQTPPDEYTGTSPSDASIATTEGDPSENPYITVDFFISTFNSIRGESVSDIELMDIRGDDYRVEFRLNSFDNAVGKKGVVGSIPVEFVNYGAWSNDSMRVYANSKDLDAITTLCGQIIAVMDSSLSYDEISEYCADYPSTGSKSILIGSVSGYIETTYDNGSVSGYTMMLDGNYSK